VSATQDTGLDYHIYKWAKITAIINEHMSTDLGGFISSVVTHNIYSSNGEKLIIPFGSIATGRYPAGLKKGMNLVFTVWEDIRTPCGTTIHLQSPGTSPMGLPGQKVDIDYHIAERFGASMMLSLINAGVSMAGGFATQGNSQAISDIQNNINKSSEIALQDSIGIKPTGYAKAGQEIAILVARDLDFKSAFKNGEPLCE
jgi:type IV secretion system protein VirB10